MTRMTRSFPQATQTWPKKTWYHRSTSKNDCFPTASKLPLSTPSHHLISIHLPDLQTTHTCALCVAPHPQFPSKHNFTPSNVSLISPLDPPPRMPFLDDHDDGVVFEPRMLHVVRKPRRDGSDVLMINGSSIATDQNASGNVTVGRICLVVEEDVASKVYAVRGDGVDYVVDK